MFDKIIPLSNKNNMFTVILNSYWCIINKLTANDNKITVYKNICHKSLKEQNLWPSDISRFLFSVQERYSFTCNL